MMTKFTREYIDNLRKSCDDKRVSIAPIGTVLEMLDEIERLQAEKEQTCEYIISEDKELDVWRISFCGENYMSFKYPDYTFCPDCGKKIKYVEEK